MNQWLVLSCFLFAVGRAAGAGSRHHSSARLRAAADLSGSGSGSGDGLAPPPLYPLPPSPTDGPPSPNPFAKVDFDNEPIGGAIMVPPPPSSVTPGSGSGSGSAGGAPAPAAEGSGSGGQTRLAGSGLPFEDPPMEAAPPPPHPSGTQIMEQRRADSYNPYCDVCKLAMLGVGVDGDAALTGACEFAPEGRKKQCDKLLQLLQRNADVMSLTPGCVDKTGPMPVRCAADPHLRASPVVGPKLYPDACPAIVMCNIIEDESGGPLCGKVLRGWGDFLPEGARIAGTLAPAREPCRAGRSRSPTAAARAAKSRRGSNSHVTPWDTYPKALEVRARPAQSINRRRPLIDRPMRPGVGADMLAPRRRPAGTTLRAAAVAERVRRQPVLRRVRRFAPRPARRPRVPHARSPRRPPPDVMQVLQHNKTADAQWACRRQPESLRWKVGAAVMRCARRGQFTRFAAAVAPLSPAPPPRQCEDVARSLLESADAQHVIASGCVDRTGPDGPVERPAGKCAGIVACNLIDTPRCGTPPVARRAQRPGAHSWPSARALLPPPSHPPSAAPCAAPRCASLPTRSAATRAVAHDRATCVLCPARRRGPRLVAAASPDDVKPRERMLRCADG